MKTLNIVLGLSVVALATASFAFAQETAPPPAAAEALLPERFAPEIAHFAEVDASTPPQSCAYLFVGSSSIRFWKSLAEDMAPYPTINRGFGGALVADVDYYFDKVVTPYKARAVFFYAGDNDLWAGKTPEKVISDFNQFMTLKTQKLGETVPVYFIAVKPSKQRISQIALQNQVNQAVRTLGETRKDLRFVDIVPSMLESGVPKDIFVGDGLHMKPEGYALWTNVVRPMIEADAKEDRPCGADPEPKQKPKHLWFWQKKS
ncbi:MAG: GDSL-type esterase/lipase family protein [Alphaproteobacteria bacterium]